MRDLMLITNTQLTSEMLVTGIEKLVATVEYSDKQILCGKFPNRVNIFLPSNKTNDPSEIFCGEMLNNGEGYVTHVEFHTTFSIKRILPAILEIVPDLKIIDDEEIKYSASEYLEKEFDY